MTSTILKYILTMLVSWCVCDAATWGATCALCVLCVLCVGGLFSVIGGPCKRYAVTLTRMPSHDCSVRGGLYAFYAFYACYALGFIFGHGDLSDSVTGPLHFIHLLILCMLVTHWKINPPCIKRIERTDAYYLWYKVSKKGPRVWPGGFIVLNKYPVTVTVTFVIRW